MAPWLVLALFGAAALAGLAAIARLASRPREWDDEEYERRRRTRSSGVLATSMRVLGEELDSGARHAAEEREEFERGERVRPPRSGDPPRPGRP